MLNAYIDTIVSRTDGRFMTVTFKKKDGSIRTINCRTGVKKHLKGGERTTDPNQYLIVWSMKDQGYRNINKETIERIVFDGMVLFDVNKVV